MTPATSKERQARLDRAQVRIMFKFPFFARGVAKLEKVIWDETITDCGLPTACTNGREIRWHPADFDKQTDGGVVTTLCEEIWHCLFNHIGRKPTGAHHRTWNLACDHALRLAFKEFSAISARHGKSDPFEFPAPKEAYEPDPRFIGMTEEAIYAQLMKKGGCQGIGHAIKIASRGKSGSNSMAALGQFTEEPGFSGETVGNAKQVESEWQNCLIQSAATMKPGTVPGSLSKFVDHLLNPTLDWWVILRGWLRELNQDDWDYMTPNLAMEGCGFIMPSLRSDKMAPVIFATDTSGSITSEMLARFVAEKQRCLDDLCPASLLDIQCDAKVQKVHEYFPGDKISLECLGGGGTDFVPVFQEIEKRGLTPKCLVFFTDLCGHFGEEPPYPVLWLTQTKDEAAPYGTVVYVQS